MNTRTLRSGIVLLLTPILLLGGVAAGATPAAAPSAAASDAVAAAAPDAVAAAPRVAPPAVSPPRIVPQANGLTGRRYLPEANRTVPFAAYSDGCNHDLGRPDQCVPLRSPASFQGSKNKQFDCAYLIAEGWFRKPLLVRKDSQNVLSRHQAARKAAHTAEGWFLTGCIDG